MLKGKKMYTSELKLEIVLRTTHRTYSGDFKVRVVEYMRDIGASMRQTAAHFNIPSMQTVSLWEHQAKIKEGITSIFHSNKGRYGYRRITMELHNRGRRTNHKTAQRLMKQLDIKCMVRVKKYRSYKGE